MGERDEQLLSLRKADVMGGGYLEEEDWERMFKMRRALEDAFVTAKIQEATGSSEVRRVAEDMPIPTGNRQQRRAHAKENRQ